jgi:hypothetical protein
MCAFWRSASLVWRNILRRVKQNIASEKGNKKAAGRGAGRPVALDRRRYDSRGVLAAPRMAFTMAIAATHKANVRK